MKLSNELNLKLTQKLTLSKEMLLSLELVQLPLLDLKERIEQEILENPALELTEKNKDEDQNIEKIEDSFSPDNNLFEDTSSADIDTGISPTSSNMDLKRQFLEGTLYNKETLYEHLLMQLDVQNLTDKQKEIGKTIISLINEDGFFTERLEDVFPQDIQNVAKDVLEIIQLFDPPGIAAHDVKEALLFQLESMKEEEINQTAYIILKDYFEHMVTRKDNEIAKLLKIKVEDVKEAFDFISQLYPYPGRAFSSKQIKYIIPDAYIYKRDNDLIVEMNDDVLPPLTINGYINKIAKETKGKKKLNEQEKYIINKVNNAKQFINLINYRKSSLFRLVLMIVKVQDNFFHKGPKFLKPLTMKEIAEEIGLSESTISRLASSKFIQTEWGLHEIKYFFSNYIGKERDSNSKSAESVREFIKEILQSEKGKKISDQKIVEVLENRGIKIARRTVAKYRKILNILPSYQRK